MWSNQLPHVVIITITATPLRVCVPASRLHHLKCPQRLLSLLLLYLGGCPGPGEDGAHLGSQSIGLNGA